MSKYFGTDGFRGEAGITLTADHAYKVGRFLGWYYNIRTGRSCPLPIASTSAARWTMWQAATVTWAT